MPVAKVLLEAGYTVFAVEVNDRKKQQFEALGGTITASPDILVQTASTILVLVLNDEQVIDVISGPNGVLQSNTQFNLICMSTINRSTLEEMAVKCLRQGINLIDCPFTGGPARIPTGNLTLITAGDPQAVESVRPILDHIGKLNLVGNSPGLGQAVKHCNQLLVGATHAATMEVITLSKRLNLDPEQVTKIVGEGIAGSDYFRMLSQSVLKNIPSPGGLGQMCKDVAIVKNSTEEVDLPALVLSAAAEYFKIAEIRGMQSMEGADLIQVVDE